MQKIREIPWLRIGAESVAIIASILLAFAIDAWYENHRNRERTNAYLDRITQELVEVQGGLQTELRSVERNIEFGDSVAGFFDDLSWQDDQDQLIIALYNMGRDRMYTYEHSTYDDLVSSGGLNLIEDVDLRETIQAAYRAIQDAENQLAPYRDEYLAGIRAWIPQSMIDDIRVACPGMDRLEFSCSPVDLDDESVESIVARVSTDDGVLAYQLRRQGLFTSLNRTKRALASIEAALNSLHERGQ